MKTKVLFTLILSLVMFISCKSGKKDAAVEAIKQELTEQTESVPTIEEVLQYRDDMKEYERKVKVFYSMPAVVLIDILRTHGTSLQISEIVDIYESNPDTYNLVKSGARSQQYLDSLLDKADSIIAPIDSVIKFWR